jgi:hypothetical protein
MSKAPQLQTLVFSLVVLVLGFFATATEAYTVHSWLDEFGVRHYADSPPPATSTEPSRIEFADAAEPGEGETSDYYSIANQWARMRDERDDNAQLALERKKLQVQREPVATATTSAPANYPVGGYRTFGNYAPYYPSQRGYRRNFVVEPHPHQYHNRGGYQAKRRQQGFSPTPVPVWPRQR